MTRGDVLHAIGLLLGSDPSLVSRDWFTMMFKLTAEELAYVDYCSMADDPEKRSYDALRGWLKANVEQHADTLRTMLKKHATFLAVRDATPRAIFDVGAGHVAWSILLQETWPKAQVFAVDRFYIPAMGWRSIEEDAVEFIESFHEDEPTLLFFSEFVHCKRRNLDALGCPKIAGCAKLVVELRSEEHAVGERLKLTGGQLVTPHDVLVAHGPVSDAMVTHHEATFRYWGMTLLPVST